MPGAKIPIHVMDFEGNTRSGIVEYGIVTLLDGKIVDTATRLCRPRSPIDPVDSRLHGIRNADTAETAPVTEDWVLFSGCRRTGPLCAHHARVEDTLLRQVWPYPGNVPDFLHPGAGRRVETWGPWVDTRALYAFLFPDLDNHQLMDLVRLFRLEDALRKAAETHCPPRRRRHHCALHDALASALLLEQIPRFPGYAHVDPWWLLYHSAPSQAVKEDWQQGDLELGSE